MRNVIMGMAIAFCMAIGGISAASAAPVSAGGMNNTPAVAADGLLQKVVTGEYCARLKRACDYKEERGQEGEGNCRRYRNECGHYNYCQALRRACEYKEERGQEGRGNCRRYRSECRDN